MSSRPPLTRGEDGRARCAWAGADPLYVRYHDEEWGVPSADDRALYEKICLEGFQAGLSWITVLRKRERFREAFAGFDPKRVARFGEREVEAMLADAGLIRHRGKLESAINNATAALALARDEGSLAAFVWRYESPREGPLRGAPPAETAESQALSRELRRRGFSFVGPTTLYAFMQAMGLVNDHAEGCFRAPEVERLRARFARPGPARPARTSGQGSRRGGKV